MQYQIREPEGFARMLEMIIETGASVFWQASEYGIRYHGLPEGEDASFFLCKELVLVILMRLLVSMQHRKAILWMSRTQKNLISSFHKHLSMPAFVHLKQVLHILKAHLLPRY